MDTPRWMFGWPSGQIDNWGTLPAVPVLYFFMLVGSLHIIATDGDYALPADAPPYWVGILWRVTTVVAPLLALTGWWMVSKHTGGVRLSGLWLRFAGDFGQATGLLVFLVLRMGDIPFNDDPRVYLVYVAAGTFFLVVMMVARDVWILWQVRKVAADIECLIELEETS